MLRWSRSGCHIWPHPSQRQYDDAVGLSPLVTLADRQYGQRSGGSIALSARVDDTRDLGQSDRSHAIDGGKRKGSARRTLAGVSDADLASICEGRRSQRAVIVRLTPKSVYWVQSLPH
jgi:hypothetical protein